MGDGTAEGRESRAAAEVGVAAEDAEEPPLLLLCTNGRTLQMLRAPPARCRHPVCSESPLAGELVDLRSTLRLELITPLFSRKRKNIRKKCLPKNI